MSRKENCWDNAVVERFFRNSKLERVKLKDDIDARCDDGGSLRESFICGN